MTHILITNDDGVDAPGLLALAQAMQTLGTITIVAPDHNWSMCGHVKTIFKPAHRERGITGRWYAGKSSYRRAVGLCSDRPDGYADMKKWTWSSRGSTPMPTWGTTSPIPARSPRRWKP